MSDDLILSVVTGSRAYGLETGVSDTDRRGVFVVPTPDFWRLTKPPTHRDGPLPEQFSWEVEVDAWRRALTAELAAADSVLPAVPDRAKVEDFLVGVRRDHL